MRKHLATFSLLFAWLCANGALSDVAQIFAWSRMFTQYARVLPVSAALTETFDASRPCELCLAVKEVRRAEEQKSPVVTAAMERLLLACSATAPLVFNSPIADWPTAAPWNLCTRVDAVPVPPPRV